MFLSDALSYPFRDLKGFLVGGVAVVSCLLVVPILFVLGYLIRIMSSTLRGEESLPAWGRWGDLFVKGVFSLVIHVVYALVLIVVVISIALCMAFMGGVAGEKGFFALLVFFPLILFVVPYSIIMQLAQVRYAKTGDINSAFEFKEIYLIFRRGLTDYVVNALVLGVVSVILVVAVFFSLMIWVGFVLLPFTYFFVYAAEARLYASIYRKYSEPAKSCAAASPA